MFSYSNRPNWSHLEISPEFPFGSVPVFEPLLRTNSIKGFPSSARRSCFGERGSCATIALSKRTFTLLACTVILNGNECRIADGTGLYCFGPTREVRERITLESNLGAV